MISAAGGDEAGPVLELGLPDCRLLWEVERPHLLAQDLRMEERFGFESHLPGDLNIQHPTSNIQRRKPLHGATVRGRRFG